MIALATIVCGVVTTSFAAWSLPTGTVGWAGLALPVRGRRDDQFGRLLRRVPLHWRCARTMLSNAERLLRVLFAVATLGESLSGLQWAGVALAVTAPTFSRCRHCNSVQRETASDFILRRKLLIFLEASNDIQNKIQATLTADQQEDALVLML